MEQQKVLIVIISAALFVAAVLGVGLALFYPDAGAATEAAFDPIEYAREPAEEPREDESATAYGEESETTETEDEGDRDERVILLTEESPTDADEEEGVSDVAEEEQITSRAARSGTVERKSAADMETAQEPSSIRESEPSREPEPQSRPVRSTTTYESAPDIEPQRIRVTEHWIQLISSPNKERVDAVRDRLREEYSLGGRLTTREIDSSTYYRLRVGPYDDRGEAEKFLAWIREIDGFSEAYISEEYPLRTVR